MSWKCDNREVLEPRPITINWRLDQPSPCQIHAPMRAVVTPRAISLSLKTGVPATFCPSEERPLVCEVTSSSRIFLRLLSHLQ